MPKMKGRSRGKAVSAKISKLVKKEGMPQKRAVATALNMSRAGRLGPKGGYRRKKRSRK
jgi:hypothetical protein